MALNIEVSVDSIVPLQAIGVSSEHLEDLRCARQGGAELPPVLVLGIEEAHDTAYLLLDGTHRAYLEYEAAAKTIGATALMTDEDLRALRPEFLQHFNTLDEVVQRYRQRWIKSMMHQGVAHLRDLPVRPGPKYALIDWARD